MRYAKYWCFQGASHATHDRIAAVIAKQEIESLTALASGLLEFEKTYTSTHGERTPVFRLLSMINEKIAENTAIIDEFVSTAKDEPADLPQPDVPF